MNDTSKLEAAMSTPWSIVAPEAAEAVQARFHAGLQLQAELLDDSQRLMTGWMRRRQEAMESGMRAFQAMCGCKDPTEASAVYGEWITGSMKRIMDDVNDMHEEAVRLAGIGQKSAACMFNQDPENKG